MSLDEDLYYWTINKCRKFYKTKLQKLWKQRTVHHLLPLLLLCYVPFAILIDFYFDFGFDIVEGIRIHIQV